jgi:5-formyltetrahydrofolate cyclo-ligase
MGAVINDSGEERAESGATADPDVGPTSKRARRSALRARRRQVAAVRDRALDARRIAEHALHVVERHARADLPVTVTAYEPLPVEPDVSALLRTAYERGMRVLVPITLPDLDLDWAVWSPRGCGPPLGPEAVADLTVAFVPGLAVDEWGTRLGQGGGCYDKALPRVRSGAPVVCVLHPEEDRAQPALPREAHDVPVDAVLTADGVRWV